MPISLFSVIVQMFQRLLASYVYHTYSKLRSTIPTAMLSSFNGEACNIVSR